MAKGQHTASNCWEGLETFLCKNGLPGPLFRLFLSLKQSLQQINVENVHPGNGAGI